MLLSDQRLITVRGLFESSLNGLGERKTMSAWTKPDSFPRGGEEDSRKEKIQNRSKLPAQRMTDQD